MQIYYTYNGKLVFSLMNSPSPTLVHTLDIPSGKQMFGSITICGGTAEITTPYPSPPDFCMEVYYRL